MKFLKWILIILTALGLLLYFVGWPYMKEQTKKNSPEKTVTYNKNGYNLSVTYSSPSKKGRDIFGQLVPYDTVWRTGANEPTTFTTATDIRIFDEVLPSGTYSLWTKPGKKKWLVMFNSDIPDWGVTILSRGKETTRIPSKDVITVEIPSEKIDEVTENFTIGFLYQDQLYMYLAWDRTKVKIPFNY